MVSLVGGLSWSLLFSSENCFPRVSRRQLSFIHRTVATDPEGGGTCLPVSSVLHSSSVSSSPLSVSHLSIHPPPPAPPVEPTHLNLSFLVNVGPETFLNLPTCGRCLHRQADSTTVPLDLL